MLQLVQQPPLAGLQSLHNALFKIQQLAPAMTVSGKLTVRLAAGTWSCLPRQAYRLSRAMQHASGLASGRLLP